MHIKFYENKSDSDLTRRLTSASIKEGVTDHLKLYSGVLEFSH